MNDIEYAIFQEIANERESQRRKGWRDSYNSCGLWVAYICNYAGRWAMPAMFDPQRYTFRACMVKVAALAVAAIEWCDGTPEPEIGDGSDGFGKGEVQMAAQVSKS